MSRTVDVNLIVNQIVEANRGRDNNARESIRNQFERLTLGLAEYERQQVAWLVNFRLSSVVL
ncbi:MAG TPA: hypothetical protein PKG54_08110 [Phycisphaerae bacterium]|jgi:hypothetical protein|nr:hypothetical protein [Phycisphaerae bacterium]HOB74475.1 hypothetical protein [Phycisphaerae bacterium]HOJ54303.1 hypothetical protein [Phycisphaerae bacterium]HOL26774.1 hypothetical protein [Phycisphaerae bacterium]HPP20660.1 hypothetical protein [Phycisphaerae bacterium]